MSYNQNYRRSYEPMPYEMYGDQQQQPQQQTFQYRPAYEAALFTPTHDLESYGKSKSSLWIYVIIAIVLVILILYKTGRLTTPVTAVAEGFGVMQQKWMQQAMNEKIATETQLNEIELRRTE